MNIEQNGFGSILLYFTKIFVKKFFLYYYYLMIQLHRLWDSPFPSPTPLHSRLIHPPVLQRVVLHLWVQRCTPHCVSTSGHVTWRSGIQPSEPGLSSSRRLTTVLATSFLTDYSVFLFLHDSILEYVSRNLAISSTYKLVCV